MYTYLASGAEHIGKDGAFRSLQRGYTLWSSGRLTHLELNGCHPLFCHIRCKMTPSMKQGLYDVYILLRNNAGLGKIEVASCGCAAGKSSCCVHVSGLLHALVALSPCSFQASNSSEETECDILPITSYECKWKKPSKRKESNLKISEGTFEKHTYGRRRQHSIENLSEFDPRPVQFRGTANELLETFLRKVKGKGLGVSLLLDSECRCWSTSSDNSLPPVLPSKSQLQFSVEELKKSLQISEQQMGEIEQSTRDQSHSSLWFSVRRFRLTASHFGEIYRRRPSTSPHSLVLRILNPKSFSSKATCWGIKNEGVALQKYCEYQHLHGHIDLKSSRCGFVICKEHQFLGASPDAVVHDPSCKDSFGLAEVKCPYSFSHLTPVEACKAGNFFCELETDSDGQERLRLKRAHPYYAQVQGQMAITGRKWCDFIIYTEKGINVERIDFDQDFWDKDLLPKLVEFFDNCFAPEVICPVHVLGMNVRNLSD